MPLLLSHNNLRSWIGSGHGLENRHHNKGETKSLLGALRCTVRVGAAAALFGSGTPDKAQQRRHAALHKHQEAAGESSAPGATASDTAAPTAAASATDSDWEAVRLMTAAKILSSSASSDFDTSYATHDDTSSLPDSLTASAELDDSEPLGALSVLDEIHSINADSLALAVGILRQQQPLDANEGDVQLSERLRDFLQVLRRRPASTTPAGGGMAAAAGLGHAARAQAAAAGHASTPSRAPATDPGTLPAAGAAAAGTGSDSDADSFWVAADEWADVRSALMNIGVNASLDEEDEEDVWDLEAGRVKTRRTRLLRSLPKLDSSTAQQLTAFLSELQQHQGHTAGAPAAHQADAHSSTVFNPPGAHAAGADGQQGQGVSEEQEQWWQQAALAYGLLRQQAGAVHQAQELQDSEEQ